MLRVSLLALTVRGDDEASLSALDYGISSSISLVISVSMQEMSSNLQLLLRWLSLTSSQSRPLKHMWHQVTPLKLLQKCHVLFLPDPFASYKEVA